MITLKNDGSIKHFSICNIYEHVFHELCENNGIRENRNNTSENSLMNIDLSNTELFKIKG